MNKFRVSKYNPKYRENGIYTKDEWTDYSDVGQVFENGILSLEEYLKTEEQYILCIISVLKKDGIIFLSIEDFEQYGYTEWKDKTTVTIDELSSLIRDCLRNKCWCKLRNNETYLHFGYDYYVYISSGMSSKNMCTICRSYNLFCEELSSPYDS